MFITQHFDQYALIVFRNWLPFLGRRVKLDTPFFARKLHQVILKQAGGETNHGGVVMAVGLTFRYEVIVIFYR